ncbi:MAG: FAD-dependent thymidylate synthase [Bacilli bacterium]|nr:FAD-dependent thymidylate synthase [Bacilli bacterium]
MEIKLLGALDYKKVESLLEEKITNEKEREDLLQAIKEIEIARRSEIVSSAGRLSRAAGTVLDIVGLSESKTLEQNINFANRVIGMGHDSISDHDYCVFAIKDVSPIVEQTIIEERFASFTIKSRREADFSQVGFYVPDFRDENGNILPNNEKLKEEYKEHMQMLFQTYITLKDMNIPIEDARFILPYCYHSNILMGMDAHSVKNLIVKLTKTKYRNITELREFGEKLYEIVQEQMPYIVPEIDKVKIEEIDSSEEYINQTVPKELHRVEDKTKLLSSSSKNIDDTILISAIMRRYHYDRNHAEKVYQEACKQNPNFKKELMKKIAFESDGLELTQVNFQFETALSLAILTHLTRHRTHDIITPDFVPNLDITNYKTPPKIASKQEALEIYNDVYALNKTVYDHFKENGVREEDLVYFTLSGTLTNVLTNMDGKTLKHILGLRECTKAQWETRQMANAMHQGVKELPGTEAFETILGPTCVTQGICNEGKECCGRVYTLQKKKNETK